MKTAVVMPLAAQRGGGELALWHLLQHGREQGVAWRVFFLEDGPQVARVRALGIVVEVVPAGRLREVGHYARTVRHLADRMQTEGVDAVLGWMSKGQLYGGAAAWWAGVPALWFQHGLPADIHWIDRLATLMPARGILTCSEAGARVQATLWPTRPTHVVYPGVEVDRFDPAALPAPRAARRRLGLPEEGPLLGMVGRLQRWKGMHVFAEAMAQLLRRHPDAHGVIVGGPHDLEPAYPGELEALLERLGLQGRVHLAGFQENVPEWMQAMDVFVHASDREPFGMVVIEAMALGKPVVAGDVAGPREIITPEENGLLAPYGDAARLAHQMLRYLDNPDFARRIGEAAQHRAQDFSVQRYAQGVIEAMYTLALKRPEGSAAGRPTTRAAQT